jgi:hypothetical protein
MNLRDLCALVGYPIMSYQLFEPFREWAFKTRRRKGSKKLSTLNSVGSARELRGGCNRPGVVLDEINLRTEPALAEFNAKLRSSKASWLNIKQLTEPHGKPRELTSTRQI